MPVRAAAVHHLATPLAAEVPPARLVSLFIAPAGRDYPPSAPGPGSLRYLIGRGKDAFFELFQHALATEEAWEPTTKILSVHWHHKEPGADELLLRLWRLGSDVRATSPKPLRGGCAEGPANQPVFEAFERFPDAPPTGNPQRAVGSRFIALPVEGFGRVPPLLPPGLAICALDTGREFRFVLDYPAENVKQRPGRCIAALNVPFLPGSGHPQVVLCQKSAGGAR